MSTTMTICIEDGLKERLDRLAAATGRSCSFLAAEALRQFVETDERQVEDTSTALKEADAGDFASREDVDALAAKWASDAHWVPACGSSPPG